MEKSTINYIGQINYAENGGVVNVFNPDEELPPIRAGAISPCSPYIEGKKRSVDLDNIDNMLKKTGQAIWVYGEGGIGKTELLCRFAETHPEYEYIFIQYKGSINQTISQNLFFLSGYEMKGMELTDIVRYHQNLSAITLYHHRLKRENRNLVLVIDNYNPSNYEKTFREMTELPVENKFSGEKNDLNAIQELLRTGILVVLTTRTTPVNSDTYLTYEVKKMDEPDLFEVMTGYFTRIVPFLVSSEIKEKLFNLIKIAESNTVFITIMALAMQTSTLSPDEALDSMIERLGTDHEYLIRYTGKTVQLRDHMEKVLGFIGLSYQDQQVLGTMTMLPNKGIDYDLYQKITTSGAVQLDQKRQKILERFVNNHIVIQKPKNHIENTQSIYMHSLVSEHAQHVLTDVDKKSFFNLIEQNWINKILHFFNYDQLKHINYQDKDFMYLAQIAAVCSSTEIRLHTLRKYLGDQYEETIIDLQRRLLFKAAELSEKNGCVKDALEYIERAICIEGPSREDLDTLRYIAHLIGIILQEGGQYSKAKHYYLIILQILNDRNGFDYDNLEDIEQYSVDDIVDFEDASLYASVFGNIAGVYKAQGNYKDALLYYKKDMAICEIALGKDHPKTAVAYNNIAGVYDDQGNYKEALKYYKKALVIDEEELGKDHSEIAALFNNIAGVYKAQGNYKDALKYSEKSMAICERKYGPNHLTTALSYNLIALIHYEQGNNAEALKYYTKAMLICERVLGKSNPDTAMTYNNIAMVYFKQGKFEKTLVYYNKALEICEEVLGKNHPFTAGTYNNIASVYGEQGNYKEALKYTKKALDIREKVLGSDHPDTATTYNNLGSLYYYIGEYDMAKEYYERALTVFETILGRDHNYTKWTLESLLTVQDKLRE